MTTKIFAIIISFDQFINFCFTSLLMAFFIKKRILAKNNKKRKEMIF